MSEKTNYIEELKKDPYLLKTLPKEYLADKDIIRAALVRKWYEYIDSSYSDNIKIFLILELFKCADATLRYNKNFVKELMESCSGYLFEFLPTALRNDEEIFIFALKHSGFEYVYERLLKDAEPDDEDWNEDAMEDIKFNLFLNIEREKTITGYAGETLLNNKEIAIKSLEFEPRGVFYFNDNLKDDYEVAITAVSIDSRNFCNISNRLKDDTAIALKAAEVNGEFEFVFDSRERWLHLNIFFLDKLSDRLKNDKNLYMTIIRDSSDGEYVLEYAPEKLKDDKELVLLAVKKEYKVIKYASERLQNDPDVLALKK